MEDSVWPNGGIFDEADEEGVFEDQEDVFDDEGPVDHRNPVTTRAEETMVSALPSAPAPKPSRQLVAVFGADGMPLVSYAVDGQPQEQFRPPTPQEFSLLKERGRFVQGGLQQSSLGAASPATGGFFSRNATLLGGVVAVAVGAGVYWYQRKKKQGASVARETIEVLAEDLSESTALVPDEIEL